MTDVEANLVVWLSQFYTGTFRVYRKHPRTTLWGMRF